jgi:hypothetical protein
MTDEIKPNAFSDAVKLSWLNALEGRLLDNVFLMSPLPPYSVEYDMETVLLVDAPHDDLYGLWLSAKIDEANGEYDRYQNTLSIFNGYYDNFVRWFTTTYAPAQGYNTGLTRPWQPWVRPAIRLVSDT